MRPIIKTLIITTGLSLFLVYSGYLYMNLPRGARAINPVADQGKMNWQKYNCGACHQVYGLGGYLGPDLTNTYSKRGEDYIKTFLKGGTVVMPNFNLDDKTIHSLVSYLKDIDASGKSDPRTYTINSDGTIQQ